MKICQQPKFRWSFGLFLCAALSACGGDGSSDLASSASASESSSSVVRVAASRKASTAPIAVQPANTAGRLLASNCFQCHGTMGTGGFEKIRGSDANEVLEYLTKTANKDIMAAHAQGYTRAQLQSIVAYLQQ